MDLYPFRVNMLILTIYDKTMGGGWGYALNPPKPELVLFRIYYWRLFFL